MEGTLRLLLGHQELDKSGLACALSTGERWLAFTAHVRQPITLRDLVAGCLGLLLLAQAQLRRSKLMHVIPKPGWRLWRYRPTSPEGVLVASWLCSAIRRSSCNPSLAPSLTRKVAMSGRSIIFFDCIFRLCRSYHLCVVAYVVVNSLGR